MFIGLNIIGRNTKWPYRPRQKVWRVQEKPCYPTTNVWKLKAIFTRHDFDDLKDLLTGGFSWWQLQLIRFTVCMSRTTATSAPNAEQKLEPWNLCFAPFTSAGSSNRPTDRTGQSAWKTAHYCSIRWLTNLPALTACRKPLRDDALASAQTVWSIATAGG